MKIYNKESSGGRERLRELATKIMKAEYKPNSREAGETLRSPSTSVSSKDTAQSGRQKPTAATARVAAGPVTLRCGARIVNGNL